jgi:hypothetical protein
MELFTKLFSDLLVFVYHCFDRIVIHDYLSGLITAALGSTPRYEPWELKRKVIELHKLWRYTANRYDLVIENKGSGRNVDNTAAHLPPVSMGPPGRYRRQTPTAWPP